jgi:hypothetical protein
MTAATHNPPATLDAALAELAATRRELASARTQLARQDAELEKDVLEAKAKQAIADQKAREEEEIRSRAHGWDRRRREHPEAFAHQAIELAAVETVLLGAAAFQPHTGKPELIGAAWWLHDGDAVEAVLDGRVLLAGDRIQAVRFDLDARGSIPKAQLRIDGRIVLETIGASALAEHALRITVAPTSPVRLVVFGGYAPTRNMLAFGATVRRARPQPATRKGK